MECKGVVREGGEGETVTLEEHQEKTPMWKGWNLKKKSVHRQRKSEEKLRYLEEGPGQVGKSFGN